MEYLLGLYTIAIYMVVGDRIYGTRIRPVSHWKIFIDGTVTVRLNAIYNRQNTAVFDRIRLHTASYLPNMEGPTLKRNL
jgi:hypothetical protein